MIDDLAEILQGYENGTYTRGGMLHQILLLSRAYPIEDIIAALPADRRAEFLAWARESFDNEIPVADFVVITQGTPSDDDLIPVTRIREWFRTQDPQPPRQTKTDRDD
jgi:hypothetical protein